MVLLPPAPPPHSFESSRPLRPPSFSRSVSAFVDGMAQQERALIQPSGNRFRHYGFGDTESRPWQELLPMLLSQTVVDGVTTDPDHRMARTMNEAYNYGGRSFLMSSQIVRCWVDQLAPLFDPGPIPNRFRQDTTDTEYCKRHLRNPQSLSKWEVFDFAKSLRTRHTHSVITQLMCQKLGWCPQAPIAPFLSEPKATSHAVIKLTKNSAIKELGIHLLKHFEGLWAHTDPGSTWWIAFKWELHGEPNVSTEEWAEALGWAVKEALASRSCKLSL
ncbi:hypothetical protein C8J57DRAFT_1389935 [Mycena rebaudengoi]|nr:hypothetical protein C8J57DRAFT_1389935 [Mycena rebaudengoi]